VLFNSFAFLLFFPVVCIIYYALPKVRLRNLFLLVASYYFYMNWEPTYALLLLFSTLTTYASALAIERLSDGLGNRHAGKRVPLRDRKRLVLTAGITANLLILFFFKYFNFAAENLTVVMGWIGIRMHVPELKVLLPVGISFYIFQAIGYMIDVSRGDVKAERNFFTYALFVSFFPQLVAGPIERSTSLLKQFYERHRFDAMRAASGINLMLWGFFLKLVLADRCAIYVDAVYNNMSHHNGASILLASCLYCFQVYGDFAGYSYIAIGSARVMGYHLMDNFHHPYFFSVSIQDFWKRNHISLTTWLMDYVYYPMVGSSTRLSWWCFSIFFTFFLSGFWHGAAWTYVVSFSIFGIYLVVCMLKDQRQKRFEKKHGLKKKAWWLIANRVATFFLVMFALVFFRATSIADAWTATTQMATTLFSAPFINGATHLIYAAIALAVVFAVEYCDEHKKGPQPSMRFYSICSTAMLIAIIAFGVFSGNQFIYFQF
jgi:D-alanyl-lipoteichoic acid acyltransferase DltB (MBOAT superfamily)